MKPREASAARERGVAEVTTTRKTVSRPDHAALRKRLNRIEGQVRGVARMVDEQRYCVDILHQIAAIRSALDATALQLLRGHTLGCVRKALQSGDGTEAVSELMDAIGRFAR
jgi:CsoR family transcriptional regulator, copper-sensing transcriptional repressor